MSQLPLPFVHEPKLGAEDFMPSQSNAAALAAVAGWPAWTDPVLLLLGPEGSGKSHLARIWAARVGATVLGRDDFERDLRDLARVPAVLEDADRADLPEAELFHLLNLVRETGSWLLITARQAPDAWGLGTPDLVSRLRLALTAELGPPDEGADAGGSGQALRGPAAQRRGEPHRLPERCTSNGRWLPRSGPSRISTARASARAGGSAVPWRPGSSRSCERDEE